MNLGTNEEFDPIELDRKPVQGSQTSKRVNLKNMKDTACQISHPVTIIYIYPVTNT